MRNIHQFTPALPWWLCQINVSHTRSYDAVLRAPVAVAVTYPDVMQTILLSYQSAIRLIQIGWLYVMTLGGMGVGSIEKTSVHIIWCIFKSVSRECAREFDDTAFGGIFGHHGRSRGRRDGLAL